MKNSQTVWKAVFLVLILALVASLIGNVQLWRDLSALTTVPVSAGGPGASSAGSGGSYSLIDRYNELRKQINRRLGNGSDTKSFITPDNPAVAAAVKEIVNGENMTDPIEYWRNVDHMYRWIVQYIDYVPDSYIPVLPETPTGEIKWVGDFWRMPEETLRDKAGDCEDLSALLASMILNYNKHTYGVWVVVVRNKDGGHAGVVFPIQKGMITVVDPAIKYNTATGEGVVITSKDADVAMNEWIARLQEKVPGAEVAVAFSDNFYQEFTGTADFVNWVKTTIK